MRLLALLGLLAALAGATSLAAQTLAPTDPVGMLEPGDSIRIQVWRKPEFSGDYLVGPDGTITHPLYRAVRVAGIPLAAAEANIRRFLSEYDQNPQFVMEPLIRVSVSGEVPRPAVFALNPRTTLAEAIARAGGTTQYGKRDRVRIFRTEGSVRGEMFFDLTNPVDPVAQSSVRSGDQIVVDRSKSLFKDVLLPVVALLGSLASIALLTRRWNR
jgi:polysaccharide export outer membrane protein